MNQSLHKISLLSIDGGAQLGSVQMHQLAQLEKESYIVARKHFCIAERPNEKIAVSELYDYIVGTQSGAIATGMLTLKDQNGFPAFNGTEARDFMAIEGMHLFSQQNMSTLVSVPLALGISLVFMYALYMLAKILHQRPKILSQTRATIQGLKDYKHGEETEKQDKLNEVRKIISDSSSNRSVTKAKKVVEDLGDVYHEELVNELIKDFQEIEKNYHERLGRQNIFGFIGFVIGMFASVYVLLPLTKLFILKTNHPEDSRAIIATRIPETAHFHDLHTAKPIITAFDFDYSVPLAFMEGSDDLYLMDDERKILNEPISILDAITASVADPFAFAPFLVQSTNPESDIHQTALISAHDHASPPTFVGMMALVGRLGLENLNVEDFLVTELAFNFKQSEDEAPTSISLWRKKLDALLYTNAASANNYLVDKLFSKAPDNFLPLRSPYGKLASDKWAQYKPLIQKTIALVQEFDMYWGKQVPHVHKMLLKLLQQKFVNKCAK